MEKIVALLDGSGYSESVCDHAAWAAQGLGIPVEMTHVIGRRDESADPRNLSGNIGLGARTQLLNELAELDAQKARLARKRGQAILEDAVARVQASGAEAVSRLRMGDLLEALSDIEDGTRLIVVGKRGEAADFAKLHLGSNLERVIRAARINVLVANRAFRPLSRMLVAYDGGPSIVKGIDRIIASPLLRRMQVHLLTVGAPTPEVKRRQDGAVALLREAGVAVTAAIEPGEPEAVIAAHAEAGDFDLLGMGAYGHSRIRRLVVGSTTSEMIRSAKAPVLLFRSGPAPPPRPMPPLARPWPSGGGRARGTAPGP